VYKLTFSFEGVASSSSSSSDGFSGVLRDSFFDFFADFFEAFSVYIKVQVLRNDAGISY
jgi:hypothetical protein